MRFDSADVSSDFSFARSVTMKRFENASATMNRVSCIEHASMELETLDGLKTS
jgi:hypothetical protein